MSAADVFRSKFDENGLYRDGNGELNVVFATQGGGRFSGNLRFKDGLCFRATIERGGNWGLPDALTSPWCSIPAGLRRFSLWRGG